MIEGIDHVAITMPLGSEAEAVRFYNSLLGMTELEKPATLAARGGSWFGMPDGRQIHMQAEATHSGQPKAHPAFHTRRLDELAALLTREGLSVLWDEALSPRRRFYTNDPFGNRLEFLETI